MQTFIGMWVGLAVGVFVSVVVSLGTLAKDNGSEAQQACWVLSLAFTLGCTIIGAVVGFTNEE